MRVYVGIIYCYMSPSKKKYVGLTTNESHRKRTFRCTRRPYTHSQSKIDLAREKYGVDKFIYGIIETLESDSKSELKKRLKEREKYWIRELDTYKNGYNSTEGGDSVDIKPEVHIRHSRHMKEKYGGKMPEHLLKCQERSLKNASDACRRPVIQYSLDGEYVQKWESATDAAKSLGHKSGHQIRKCVKGRAYSAYGYLWKEVGDSSELILNRCSYRKVGKYDIDGNLLAVYNSCKEATEKNPPINNPVDGCCNKNSKSDGVTYTRHGYVYKYLNYGT